MSPVRDRVHEYCRETGTEPPVNMVTFSVWLANKHPDESDQFEKNAAKVLNNAQDRQSLTS